MCRLIISLVILFIIQEKCLGDTYYKLNIKLKPSSYKITVKPYFNTSDEKAFTFDGEVDITFKPSDFGIKQIKLHSEDLTFNETDVTVTTSTQTIALVTENPLEFEKNYTFVYINLQEELQNDTEYILSIKYTGNLRNDLNGFYQSYYVEDGVKKWLGATQMEPTHARKVFPCFDEPEYKAVFNMIIVRPQYYTPSLSNMEIMRSEPIENGYVRETFYPTPIMSTYLLAFLVSEFEPAAQNTTLREFGIYSRPEAANQSAFAFDFGQRVVNELSVYFGIDYYSSDQHLRLDHVALPDFRAGAMENWGLIKYREAYLMYVPEESSPDYKYGIAQIVAHETTHMWFGNLVTCHWWSDTWLNEGFANYFQDYITQFIEPEVESGNILVTGSVYTAYDADEVVDAPAISNSNVYSPAEISTHFGTITYQKAGSVIRMMHHLIGNEGFKNGLNIYLNANKFDLGTPSKLYEALEQGASIANSFNYSKTVTEVMESWISQAGHPLLTVHIDYSNDIVTLTQKRFYTESAPASNATYHIPITFTTEFAPDFDNTKPEFIMVNDTHTFTIANISENHSWVIFNIQETGFYRVNYDEHSWSLIASALKGNRSHEIHNLNRAKIVNDLFALLYGDEIQFDTLVEVLEFLKDEEEYSVWYAAIRGLNRVTNSYLGTDLLDEIQAFSLEKMEHIIQKLGYKVNENDSLVTERNRMQVLSFACKMGHKKCVEDAVALFKSFKENNTEIQPSLRPYVYCYALRQGDADDYDFLLKRLLTTNVANDARNIATALGCTSNEDRLIAYLLSVSSEGPIRLQDETLPITSALSFYSNLNLVMNSLKQNYSSWRSTYKSMETILTTVATALHQEEEFKTFTEFLDGCSECDQQAVVKAKASMEKARKRSTWAENHKADIAKFTEFLDGCSECDQQAVVKAKASMEKARKRSTWAENHKADIAKILNGGSTINRFSILLLLICIISSSFFN